MDALFTRFARAGHPGAGVLVVRDGQVLARAAYGLADVQRAVPATSTTNYRLASLTKPFTALAVLQLVDEGRLALDEPVAARLPELPGCSGAITVRHLLSHTSGLWDYEDFVPEGSLHQVTDHEALHLAAMRAPGVYFPAGSAWRYSNTGYVALALLVERVRGAPFAEVLASRVFGPLGMTHTVVHEAGRTVVAHRAYGHRVSGDRVVLADQGPTTATLGDGGIYSSIDDLALWDAALARGTLLSDGLWREATTPFVCSDGTPTTYGFGWFIERVGDTHRMRHHGETTGFTHVIDRYPDARVTIVVLTNRSDSAPWNDADRIAAMLGIGT